MEKKYSILIKWSEVDNCFLASIPELQKINPYAGMSHGDTRQEALGWAEDALSDWLDTAKAEGWEIPEPNLYKDETY